jgi:hypothetical protein
MEEDVVRILAEGLESSARATIPEHGLRSGRTVSDLRIGPVI